VIRSTASNRRARCSRRSKRWCSCTQPKSIAWASSSRWVQRCRWA
jgi:hypothetical protein